SRRRHTRFSRDWSSDVCSSDLMSVLQPVPGLRLAAPRDGSRLIELFGAALEVHDAPTVVRFPKGAVASDIEAIERVGATDVLARADSDDVLIVAAGPMATAGGDAADRPAAQGVGVTVVDPRWVKPVDPALIDFARQHRLVATVEDNGRVGGVGSAFAQALRDAGIDVPVREFGIPQRFLEHGSRDAILGEAGLTGQDLAREISGFVAALDHGSAHATTDSPTVRP